MPGLVYLCQISHRLSTSNRKRKPPRSEERGAGLQTFTVSQFIILSESIRRAIAVRNLRGETRESSEKQYSYCRIAPEYREHRFHRFRLHGDCAGDTDIVISYCSNRSVTEPEFTREVALWILRHVHDISAPECVHLALGDS